MSDSKVINLEFEAVRQSGITNMFDYQKVHDVATANGLTELAEASKTPQEYSKVLVAYEPPPQEDYQKWHAHQETIVSIAKEILHQNDD